MNVTFRVDASDKIGTGNLMRCLTLAEALRDTGAAVQFFCRQLPGDLIALLKQRSIPVTALPAPTQSAGFSDSDGYAAWLGVSQREDANQVIALLHGNKLNWLVVDHYGLDIEWENRLAPYFDAIMVIDDIANRSHNCYLLLDQNFTSEVRYQHLVPRDCTMLLGPNFALLGPEYAAYRSRQARRRGAIKRVLVYFGGSDTHNISERAMQALSSARLQHLFVDLVIGSNNPHLVNLRETYASRPFTCIYEMQVHLAELMAQADLAIGAGGATTWERMCLGLPSLVVTCAANQVPLARSLHQDNLIWLIGDAISVTVADLYEAVLSKLSGQQHERVATTTSKVCDGCGTLRVVKALESSRV